MQKSDTRIPEEDSGSGTARAETAEAADSTHVALQDAQRRTSGRRSLSSRSPREANAQCRKPSSVAAQSLRRMRSL
jgi:hypothetical protein